MTFMLKVIISGLLSSFYTFMTMFGSPSYTVITCLNGWDLLRQYLAALLVIYCSRVLHPICFQGFVIHL